MSGYGIRGYTAHPSAMPGGSVDVHLSCDERGAYRARLVRLFDSQADARGEIATEPVAGTDETGEVSPQRTQVGSFVEFPTLAALDAGDGLSAHLFVCPTGPELGRQGILSHWSLAEGAGWSLEIDEEGRFRALVGDGGESAEATGSAGVFAGIWYSVALSFDSAGGELTLDYAPVLTSANSLFGPVVPLRSEGRVTTSTAVRPGRPAVPVSLGALPEAAADGDARTWYSACFYGKVEAPRIWSRPLAEAEIARLRGDEGADEEGLVAHWSLAPPGALVADTVPDLTGSGHDGECVNTPDLGITGHNWTGKEDAFPHAPEQYAARWLHGDALDDCRWPKALTMAIPDDLASGVYAVEVEQDGGVEHVPFFVRPRPDGPTKPAALLMPTMTYVVYGNHRNVIAGGPDYQPHYAVEVDIPLGVRDREYIREPDDYGLSGYDTHADGRGVFYNSWRRPLLDMRPRQTRLWNFPTDMQLVAWLAEAGFEHDVITDHDLHAEPELLERYRVVMTGSHPEYYTEEMVDAWERYLGRGGRGMYLGGNGMYWITALHPDKPWLAEVRRGEVADSPYHGRPGELRTGFTGEKGGLWRARGRAPQKVWATGYGSHGFDRSSYYVALSDASDPRLDWMFEGIDRDRPIGDSGEVGGGASGLEMDVYDRSLGTPPHTLLVATSIDHTAASHVVPEEIEAPYPGMNGGRHPRVRADITYFTTDEGGGMFSTSSIAWCNSLRPKGGDNAAARLTANVLRRFIDPAPLDSTA